MGLIILKINDVGEFMSSAGKYTCKFKLLKINKFEQNWLDAKPLQCWRVDPRRQQNHLGTQLLW